MQCFTQKKNKNQEDEEEELDVVKLRYMELDQEEQKKRKPIRAFFNEFQEQSVLQLDAQDYEWLRVKFQDLKEALKTNDEKIWQKEMQENKQIQHQQKVELDQLLEIFTEQRYKIREMEAQKEKKIEELDEMKKTYLKVLIKTSAIKKELINQQNKFADQVHLVLNQIQEANLYY
ncbi:unnamed protein product (macronuclear) [Paramecium tetraurelia]|uniref:Uncharacterized protein n=1 Tax=Paramecium tetraurelia TaxID=5888 RepID=A0BVH1_PARTE|nr:uncharacterized protein GSPATT00005784001 [Paramecium tetraurelia]CAK62538.1 unnamed protein product [Paramecium tetraurelia]|eukprot:XP_001429936.1 hypothetical protein (macronuclear) [Paramecium tetraurelia strain d4-2]